MEVDQRPGGGVTFIGSSPISSAPPTPEEQPPDQFVAPNTSYGTYNASVTKSNASNSSTKPANASNDGKVRKKPGPKPKVKPEDDSTARSAKGSDDQPKKKRKPRDPNNPPAPRKKAKPTPPPAGNFIITNGNNTVQSVHQMSSTQLTAPKNPYSPQSMRDTKPQPNQVPGIDVFPSRPETYTRYDPVRSASADISASKLANKPTEVPYKPRPSPTIASLISPPQTSTYPTLSNNRPQSSTSLSSAPIPQGTYQPYSTIPATAGSSSSQLHPPGSRHAPMEIDVSSAPTPTLTLSRAGTPSGNNASPKPTRAPKEAPMPTGSGLLSSATFGKPSEPKKPKEYAAVPNQCIVIDVPMGQAGSSYVNFIKEVENKYGFDVAHPRLAEHRDRMRRMNAAAGAVMAGSGEGGLSEELSEPGSDLEMDDVNGIAASVAGNSTDAGGPKRKTRKPKTDEYDKDDDFIDDAELLWEEQALAVKDGYFVWSGPLITDKDKPAVERADGTSTTTKRGRGGRSRGGAKNGESTGRTARSSGGNANGGKGSKGGTTVRKSRTTKAEKAKMDSEKAERERVGMASAGAMKNGLIPGVVA